MAGPGLYLLGFQLENIVAPRVSVVLDNARFLMLTLVLATELLTPQYPGFLDLLSLMNPFQTRTLAFISGFVNKTSTKSSCRDLWMKSRNTVVQILIFVLLLEPICYPYMLGKLHLTFRGYFSEITHQLLFPGRNVQWYLYGLLWWRSIDFVTAHLHIAGRMALALMLSQVAKLHPSSFLSLSESFACLPLFVAGAICRRKWMQIDEYIREELDNSMPLSPIFGNRVFQVVWGSTLFLYFHLARCIFGGIYTCPMGTTCPWKLPEIYHQDIRWSAQVFSQLNGLAGDFMMLGQVVIFLLLICPRQKGFLTPTGRQTLFPYMLHHPLMPSAKQGMDWILSLNVNGLLAWIFLMLSSGNLVYCLASPKLRQVFNPILQPCSHLTS